MVAHVMGGCAPRRDWLVRWSSRSRSEREKERLKTACFLSSSLEREAKAERGRWQNKANTRLASGSGFLDDGYSESSSNPL